MQLDVKLKNPITTAASNSSPERRTKLIETQIKVNCYTAIKGIITVTI
jgi:hypothetical protein